MSIEVCASILSANYLELGMELKRCESAGCKYIHVDVMDGCYVDNIAVGICVAKWLSKGTSLRLDAHMAVSHPQDYVDVFGEIGINTYMFHPETYPHHYRLIDKIRENNMKVGVVLTPTSNINVIMNFINEIDVIDQLAVDVGFPQQSFRPIAYERLGFLKKYKEEHNCHYEIQVDGGINDETAKKAVEAGAEVLISGSWLFENKNMKQLVDKIHNM